jgi:hypothetical protein
MGGRPSSPPPPPPPPPVYYYGPPSTTITYQGKVYGTIDHYSPYNYGVGCMYNYFVQVPNGWSIARNDAESRFVAGNYGWGTHVVGMSDGCYYGTGTYSRGALFGCYNWRTFGGGYSVPFCHARILISTGAPTQSPTPFPIANPTARPIANPTAHPIANPTEHPIAEPTEVPTLSPTKYPIADPTLQPVAQPSQEPTKEPTKEPIAEPTHNPTLRPTPLPSLEPTTEPTYAPSFKPTLEPIAHPTKEPSEQPSHEPTKEPTLLPTIYVPPETMFPTEAPTMVPYEGKGFCTFEFKKTENNVADLKKVAPGCVVIAVDDLDYLDVGKNTQVAYVCTTADKPLKVTVEQLAKGGLVDSISDIIPGKAATCNFYTGSNLDGLSKSFSDVWHPSLTSFHFENSNLGNDAIKSFYIESTTSTLSSSSYC